jgi:hypothetical protein
MQKHCRPLVYLLGIFHIGERIMNNMTHCIAGISIAIFAASVMAQQKPVVIDGNLWMSSSAEARKAFLAGANSMISLEMAYASKKGTQPPTAGTAFHAATGSMTLDEMSNRITRWYENNPNRRNLPVLGAAWIDMVSPSAGKPAQ